MNRTKVQTIIESIILDVKTRGWKFNKATKKAQNQMRELGLDGFVPGWMMQDGAKADAILNEIIKQATNSGGKIVSGSSISAEGEGDSWSSKTTASALYQAMNEVETPVTPEATEIELVTLFEAQEYQMHPARGMVCSRDVMVGDTEYKAHLHRSQNPFDGTFSYTSVFGSVRRGAVGVSAWSFNSDGTTDGYTPVAWEKAVHEQYFAQLQQVTVNA